MPELSESVAKLLKDKNFVFISTLNPDGSPHVTPTWVDTDGEHIIINTEVGLIKYRNIINDSRVAVSLVEQSNPYNNLTAQGIVVEKIMGSLAEDHMDKLAKKYMGVEKYPFRQPGVKRIIFKIRPTRIAVFIK